MTAGIEEGTLYAPTNVLEGPAAAALRGAKRHLLVVRISHWMIVVGVLGLLVSGGGILLSHPRLYWGETGAVGAPSLIDLPLPFIIGPSVWNRPYHFFFAWVLVLGALVYAIGGLVSGHLRKDLLPPRTDLRWSRIGSILSNHLRWKRPPRDETWTYHVVQRLIYLGVIFVLVPGIVWTGLAMSFGVTSVLPFLATALGGHQSARTLHFAFASLFLLYLIAHIAMISLVGFRSHVQAMITGRIPQEGNGR